MRQEKENGKQDEKMSSEPCGGRHARVAIATPCPVRLEGRHALRPDPARGRARHAPRPRALRAPHGRLELRRAVAHHSLSRRGFATAAAAALLLRVPGLRLWR